MIKITRCGHHPLFLREMDGLEEELSPDQFLVDFLNADSKYENTWKSFTEIIITNDEYFANLTRTDLLNFSLV